MTVVSPEERLGLLRRELGERWWSEPDGPGPAAEVEAWIRDGDRVHEAALRVEAKVAEVSELRGRLAELTGGGA